MEFSRVRLTSCEPSFLGARRHQHVSGHPSEEAPAGVGYRNFNRESFDIAFSAADVTRSGVIALHALEENVALKHIAGRQTNLHLIAKANRVDVALFHVGAHPQMIYVHDDHDG